MEALAKSDLVIKVTVEDAENEPVNAPEKVKNGIKWLEAYVVERHYEDFASSLVKNPRTTDRGVLYAEGTFAGPSPNNGENRDPEDFSEYRFIVVEDKDYEDLFLVEAYYHTRLLAKFEVKSDALKLLSGEIETVE